MKTARFQYKCRHCGEVTSSLQINEEWASSVLIEALLGKQQSAGGMILTLLATHRCADDQVGITDLIGYTLTGE